MFGDNSRDYTEVSLTRKLCGVWQQLGWRDAVSILRRADSMRTKIIIRKRSNTASDYRRLKSQ